MSSDSDSVATAAASLGGRLVAEGRPEDIAKHSESYTGQYLAKALAPKRAKSKRRKASTNRSAA